MNIPAQERALGLDAATLDTAVQSPWLLLVGVVRFRAERSETDRLLTRARYGLLLLEGLRAPGNAAQGAWRQVLFLSLDCRRKLRRVPARRGPHPFRVLGSSSEVIAISL